MQHEGAPAWLVPGLDRLPALPGETLAGRYRIERVLGAGGMGIVLTARDVRASRRVAVKMLNPRSACADDVARFRLEAEILGSIESRQVAELFEVGEVDGLPYLAMEYFEGRTLADALESEGPFSVERAITCVIEICRALFAVHAKGVVHRDVKLENLLLVDDAGRLGVKLIDFGISKLVGVQPVESPGCSVGSPRYMAPEQVERASDVDHRADIWSVGIVLFELLTGEHPFVTSTMRELRHEILEAEAPSVASYRPDVPPSLAEIVERCLMKDRADRFQTTAELSDALERVMRPIALAS